METPLEKIIVLMNKGIEIHKATCDNYNSKNSVAKYAAYRLWGQCNSIISICESMLEDEKSAYSKAEQWDKLGDEIAKYYVNESDDEEDFEDEGNLCDIGETAAIAYGYL